MTPFEDYLRRGMMDANIAQYGRVIQRMESQELDASPRYYRERMRLLADPWNWAERRTGTGGKRLNWRLIAIVAALLLLSACAVAAVTGQFAQWFPGMRVDPEAPEASEEIVSAMGTVVGQSQTVDGVTVTFNAAVWDGQWLYLSLTAEGEGFPAGLDDDKMLYDLECQLFLAEEDQRTDYLRKEIESSYTVSHIEYTEESLEEDVRSALEPPHGRPCLQPSVSVAEQHGNALTLVAQTGLFSYVEEPVLTLHLENLRTIEEFNLDNGEFHGFSASIGPDGTVETSAELSDPFLTGPFDFTFTLDNPIPTAYYGADLDLTYENIPLHISKITITPFQSRAKFTVPAQVDLYSQDPGLDKLYISFEQSLAMGLKGLWLKDGEYVECIGAPTMNVTPDGEAEGEMISTQRHLVDPASVTAVSIGGKRVELSKLERLDE